MKKNLLILGIFLSLLTTSHAEEIKSPKVLIHHEFLNGDIIKISINSENFVKETLGISFDLNYSKDNLNFLRYNSGNFLEQGGDPIYLVENILNEHKIVFGQTLRRTDNLPIGGGKIVDFYFQIINGNSFDFNFESTVVSTLDPKRQDLENIIFEDFQINKLEKESKKNSEKNKLQKIDIEKKDIKYNRTVLFSCLIVGFIIFIVLKRYNGKE